MTQNAKSHPILPTAPENFSLSGVDVRLIQPPERLRFDALLNAHHYWGFQRLAGRGLRSVATFDGQWLGLATWQNGAFKCRPRDRWIGWKPNQQFDRLDLIANNTRFLVLSNPGVLPNFASHFLGQMTRKLPADWLAAFGRQARLAETFDDPEPLQGTMCTAANGSKVGKTKGFARCNGRKKEIYVKSLRRDATRLRARLPTRVVPPRTLHLCVRSTMSWQPFPMRTGCRGRSTRSRVSWRPKCWPNWQT